MKKDIIVEKIAEYHSKLIISQYQNEPNLTFLKNLFSYIAGTSEPINWENYFDFLNASGDHLTEIAFTLFNISRQFDNVTLTDEELKIICNYKIIKNNIKLLSFQQIESMINNIFGNNILVKAESEKIFYFIRKNVISSNILAAIFKFNLLPQPINATMEIVLFQTNFKVWYLPKKNVAKYNDALSPWMYMTSSPQTLQGVGYLNDSNYYLAR